MAINFDFKNKENKQKLMIGILISVLIVTFFVLYVYFFKSQKVISLSTGNQPPMFLSGVQGGELNIDILSNPAYQNLKKFGDYPVDVKDSDLGRANPFITF